MKVKKLPRCPYTPKGLHDFRSTSCTRGDGYYASLTEKVCKLCYVSEKTGEKIEPEFGFLVFI